MSEPFLSEIKMVGFNFPPRGWTFCDGQTLPINQNQSLYSLLGTTFGGDGRTTFALPDLRGRTPVKFGDGPDNFDPAWGNKDGQETVTLTTAEIPSHSHTLQGSTDVALPGNPGMTPTNQVLAEARANPAYAASNGAALNSGSIANNGGGQAHNNMQPFITINFCIALQGLFPSRN